MKYKKNNIVEQNQSNPAEIPTIQSRNLSCAPSLKQKIPQVFSPHTRQQMYKREGGVAGKKEEKKQRRQAASQPTKTIVVICGAHAILQNMVEP